MPNIADMFKTALQAEGETYVKQLSSRVVMTFTQTITDDKVFYYIGNRGSLRYGTTLAASRVAPDRVRQRLFSKYREIESADSKVRAYTKP